MSTRKKYTQEFKEDAIYSGPHVQDNFLPSLSCAG
jgi:hypothetical protein